MPRPTFSVLINNYNYARFVGRSIESALAQTETDREIIVVDDGSTDDSRAALEAYAGRVTVVLQRNGGQAAAINAAVGASRGHVLCFLDADDWWAPGKLAAVAAAFRSDPRLALVYHRLQPIQDERPVLKPIPRTLCSGDLARRMVRSAGWWPFPMTSAISVRRTSWQAAGDIPAEFRISADAWLAGIYPFVGTVASLSAAHGFYRIHSNNWYRAADDATMLRKRMAHWHATVEATNRFLAARGARERLNLADHLPCQVASAKLDGADAHARIRLALQGLLFAGEPNLLRRLRDVLVTDRALGRIARSPDLREAAR